MEQWERAPTWGWISQLQQAQRKGPKIRTTPEGEIIILKRDEK